METNTDQPLAEQPTPGSTPIEDYPGHMVVLRDDEVATAFPGGLPIPGHIYALLCVDVLKGEAENAGTFAIGFKYVPIAKTNTRPSGLIVPGA